MAKDPAENLGRMDGDPLEVSPLAGTRSQSMQRLQIGLFGLAAMILLVSLANVILNNAAKNEALVVPEAAPTVAGTKAPSPVSDPLADAGVVPDMPDKPDEVMETQGQSGAPPLQP